NHRDDHVRVEPRRKPIGCVFWPIAYFFSLGFVRLVPRGAADDVRRARVLAAGAAAGGAGVEAAAGSRRICMCRGRVRPPRVPLASSLTAIVRWLVRCLMKKARPMARGCTRL